MGTSQLYSIVLYRYLDKHSGRDAAVTLTVIQTEVSK
jgi:hypothetical protein